MKTMLFLISLFFLCTCTSASLKKNDSEILEELRMRVECPNCNPTRDDLILYYHYLNKNLPNITDLNKSYGVLVSDQTGWENPPLYTSKSKGGGLKRYYDHNFPSYMQERRR